MNTPFKPGDRVRCIVGYHPQNGCAEISEGEIYTVRGIRDKATFQLTDTEFGVFLEGIYNENHPDTGKEISWRSSRFELFESAVDKESFWMLLDSHLKERNANGTEKV